MIGMTFVNILKYRGFCCPTSDLPFFANQGEGKTFVPPKNPMCPSQQAQTGRIMMKKFETWCQTK